jgi:cell division transport system ATP-binding protein
MKLLTEINQRGTTVLIATHEKSIVDNMKKRVIQLNRGELTRDEEKGLYGNEDKNIQIYS